MKTIILVRHAKSSWDDPEWDDFERPLNKRGKMDAPFMAELISSKLEQPDIFLSSPAQRALTTALEYAKAFGINENSISLDKKIYELGKRYILDKIKNLDEDFDSVILFGHNPDITSLSTYFSGEFFDNVPTCGTLCVDIDVASWKEIEDRNGSIRFYEIPKKYPKKERQQYLK